MKKRTATASLLFASLLFGANANALVVDRLYESAIVNDKRVQNEELLRQGLEQVLTRVSGNPQIIQSPIVQEALNSPNKYVQQYGMTGDKLEATFSPGLVQSLLKEAKFPIWGNNRPVVVVWLAIEDGQGRRLVGTDSDPSVVSLVDQTAQERGIPLVVPLLDLEDMSRVTVTDISSSFPSALKKASERYDYDGVLVAKISKAQTGWNATWRLLIDGKEQSWSHQQVGMHDSIKQGVEQAVNHLAELYALQVEDGDGQSLLVAVDDIHSVDDYAKVKKLLESLSVVESVSVANVSGTSTVFEILPKKGSDSNHIAKAMTWDDNLVQLAQTSRESDIRYRYVPVRYQ